MLHRVRLELTVLVAVAISITALVFSMSDNSGQTAVAVPQPEQDSEQITSTQGIIPKGAREVNIVGFLYDPDPVRVAVGTTVAWSNSDRAAHTVTADDRSWGSASMAEGDVYVMSFDEPGVYVYFCELHPPRQAGIMGAAGGEKLVFGGGGVGMQGTIIVE